MECAPPPNEMGGARWAFFCDVETRAVGRCMDVFFLGLLALRVSLGWENSYYGGLLRRRFLPTMSWNLRA